MREQISRVIGLEAWRALQLFCGYRVLLAVILVISAYTGGDIWQLGQHAPALFSLVAWGYLLFALLCLGLSVNHQRHFAELVKVQIIIDILVIATMLYASGGIQSGLAIFLLVAIAAGSSLLAGQTSLIFAAIASIALLLSEFFATGWQWGGDYREAGLLGIAFFITALLGQALMRRVKVDEALLSQQREDLSNLEKLNAYILQHLHDGILVLTQSGHLRMINEAAWQLLDRPTGVVTKPLVDINADLYQRWQAWQEDGDATSSAFQVNMHGPKIIAEFAHIPTEDGATMALLRDASKVASHAQQTKLAALGRLTASIAHEIRNPLGAVSHATQLLQESSALPEEEARLLQIINHHTDRMNRVIQNVLQLSKRKQVVNTRFRLQAWLTQYVETYQANSAEACEIDAYIDPEDVEIGFDQNQLEQVLTILVENGLRYSLAASGVAAIQLTGGITAEQPTPFLDIIDHGAGVQPDNIEHIFEPFYTTESKGLGLGLYIAKELCEANNAELVYIPLPIEGSCFRLLFDVKEFSTGLKDNEESDG